MEKKNPIEEAKRYLQNAKDVLKNNTTVDNDGYYSDSKYVRMAGNTAWNGCLIALDAAYDIKKRDMKISLPCPCNHFLTKTPKEKSSGGKELYL